MTDRPKLVKPFHPDFFGNVEFQNIGQPNEVLRLTWHYPLVNGGPGVFGAKNFTVGTDVFLETPTDINLVSDEALIASLSMALILGGESLPRTTEFLEAIVNQDTKNFQTIVGEVRVKPETSNYKNPVVVYDESVGKHGTVFDIEF